MDKIRDILHDLDLLDDWLAGKGYTEEAGLVLRTMTLIHEMQIKMGELVERNNRENKPTDPVDDAQRVSLRTLPD